MVTVLKHSFNIYESKMVRTIIKIHKYTIIMEIVNIPLQVFDGSNVKINQ